MDISVDLQCPAEALTNARGLIQLHEKAIYHRPTAVQPSGRGPAVLKFIRGRSGACRTSCTQLAGWPFKLAVSENGFDADVGPVNPVIRGVEVRGGAGYFDQCAAG